MADRKVAATASERCGGAFASVRADAEEERIEAIVLCDDAVREMIETARRISAIRAKLVAENVRSSAAAMRRAA